MLQQGPCDVCVLVLGDREVKRVSFCGMCSAWLCDSCKGRYDLRAIAMVKQKAQELLARLQSKEM